MRAWPISALLNYATLALAGRPWGITSAFALWGAKAASGLGVDVSSWAFWQMPGNAKALAAPVWEDITSVMDIGIVLGALLAAGLALARFLIKPEKLAGQKGNSLFAH